MSHSSSSSRAKLTDMHKTIEVDIADLKFKCRVAGDPQHEAIILLHGFPETSFMWIKLMDELASRGFFCLAPDMRGYSEHACPKGVENYTTKKLGQDIINLANALGKEIFHLIGHDWGAAIGWYMADKYASSIISWTALSIPHVRAFGKAYKVDKEQRKKSRYIGWFLIPYLPELMLRRNDLALLKKLWKQSSPEELENYLSVFRRKRSLTGALNYYRANMRRGRRAEKVADIHVPTLFIWGKHDLAVGAYAVEISHQYVTGEYTFLPLEAGHWLIQSNYPEVSAAIIGHVIGSTGVSKNN